MGLIGGRGGSHLGENNQERTHLFLGWDQRATGGELLINAMALNLFQRNGTLW
jgi:hypothetical protein